MTKQETNIILNHYESEYTASLNKFDKKEILYSLRFLLKNLGLNKERYQIENKCICKYMDMNNIVSEVFEMIFDTFAKYGRYVNYSVAEIEDIFDDLQYEISNEEIKCHHARINIITDYFR